MGHFLSCVPHLPLRATHYALRTHTRGGFMKRCKTIAIFVCFGLTWLALLWLTGSKTPWQLWNHTESGAAHVISLGDMAGRNYDRMGFDGGEVLYVKSDGGWLVGTANGELIHFDKNGEELWSHSVGTGLIRGIAVSQDEKVVYAGEKSPQGTLYAMDVKNGNVLWTFQGDSLIGYEANIQSEPTAIHISTDSQGNAYAVFYRFTIMADGQRGYVSRIISFDKNGNENWRYPKEGNMDAWVNCGALGEKTNRYAFATANYDKSKTEGITFNKNIYILDDTTGELVAEKAIPPAPSFGTTTIRNGLSFSDDGEYLTAMASDGRGFLMDKDGNMIWTREISKIMKVGESYYNAAGRDAMIRPEGVVFGTINTFNRENWQLPAPVMHPSGNSLYLFDLEGHYRFRYQAPTEIEEIDFAPSVAALALGRNVRNHNYKAHGAAVVSLTDGSLLNEYHTAGPVQAISISDDGLSVAGIEVPAVTPEGNLLGAYRLHIWER